jgi:filamentous hemagglutinin
MSLMSGGAETEQSQAIAANISQLAEQNPEGAVRALGLLAAFQGKQNHAQQNFGPLLLGVPIYEALGAALLVSAGVTATPAGQESLAAAANAVMEASGKAAADMQEQLRLSAELWTLVVGTAFPIHALDPKYGTLVNPVVDLNGKNPTSGGYAEGGRIITTPHTGGNQLDGQQGDTSYTNPVHQLNPGNMYSEGASTGVTGYTPNAGSVGNMKEFLQQPGFGNQIQSDTRKTSQQYQGQSIYQATGDIGSVIKRGDQIYLDGQHKNHLEVFDKKGGLKYVLNLDGSINDAKTKAAAGRRLKL